MNTKPLTATPAGSVTDDDRGLVTVSYNITRADRYVGVVTVRSRIGHGPTRATITLGDVRVMLNRDEVVSVHNPRTGRNIEATVARVRAAREALAATGVVGFAVEE